MQSDARGKIALAVSIASLLSFPSIASAQAIGGTVTDATGSVLPGVTVEVRSPALIEQVRGGVTDSTGQYLIVALEPGVYSVTFTLAGFRTLLREGVELRTGFTANLDARLSVGAVEETVTVTGATPAVDAQNVRRSEVINQQMYEALPTSRTYDSLALFIPAMNNVGGATTSLPVDTGGIAGNAHTRYTVHGSEEDDAQIDLDGLDANTVGYEGTPQGTPFDTAIQEYVYDYSGNSAEVETGAVRLNMIPKVGGNTFRGGMYADFAHSSWLANNIDQKLINRGITGGRNGGVKLDQAWYVAPSLGGPILQDRLWFFTTYSFRRGSIFPANLFDSQDTSALVYVPDLSRPTIDRQDIYEGTLRLTWQATSKDKVQAYWSNNHTHQIPALSGSQLEPLFVAPDAGTNYVHSVNTYQLTWVRPQTNRILFEAGVGLQPTHFLLLPTDDATARTRGGRHLNARIDLPGTLESSTLAVSRNHAVLFGGGTSNHISTDNTSFRASMSYVTGSHNVKIGVNTNRKVQTTSWKSASNWTTYITSFGNPIVARFYATPARTDELDRLGIFAQEQWSVGQLTVNAGLRFDYFKAGYPDHVAAASTWAPRERFFSGATTIIWKDLQPRLGLVYDVRGDGRLALKASASRYGDRTNISVAGRVNPASNNTVMSRSWYDGRNPFGIPGLPSCIGPVECIPGDGFVQGDPLNPAPNGEIMSPNTTPGFATPTITHHYDPDWAFGWGKKLANWEFSGGVEAEVAPAVSVDVAYFRRSYVNFSAIDNRSNDPEDWDRYTILVPRDPRLPGGGGFPVTLVDLNPAAVAVPDNITISADSFGGRSRIWQGADLNFSARIGGTLLQGGYALGRETRDACALQDGLPETINQGTGRGDTVVPLEFCSNETPWISQASVFGLYTFPYRIVVSGMFFSRQGPQRLAVYRIPVPEAAAALGRQPTETNLSVNVIKPGTDYGDRLKQFDFRLARVLDFGGTANLRVSLDIHNLFNANAVARELYGLTNYLQPVGVQPGRLAKVGFQFNF
jgi:hypothetical protein